jgi:Ca2+-binding EF-hand superfamily protein
VIDLKKKPPACLACHSEVGTIVRSLGFNPTELQLKELIDKMEDDANPGYVTIAAFLPVATRIIQDDEIPRDSYETILRAFQVFDTEGRGYIEVEDLREALTAQGERFSEEEIESLIRACADSTTGRVMFEEYASLLAEN